MELSIILTICFALGRHLNTFITKSVQWIKEDLDKPKQENLNHAFSIHSEITTVNIFVSTCLDILVCLFFLQKKRNEKENTWHFMVFT